MEQARVGQLVLGVRGLERREERLLGRMLAAVLLDLVRLCLEEDRGRLGDEIGEVVVHVDRRGRMQDGNLAGLLFIERGSAGGANPAVRGADCVPRAAEDRAERRAGQEQDAGDREQDAEDRRAGRTETERNDPLGSAAHGSPVPATQGEHQAEQAGGQPEAEWTDGNECALGDDEHSHRDQDHRRQVRGIPDRIADEMRDGAAAQPEPEDGREKDADRDEGKADQLGAVMCRHPCALRPRTPLGPGRRFWGRLMNPPSARHDGHFASRLAPPSW